MTVPALVDSHCHVAEPEFDADRAAVLARAAAAGVTTLVCVGATGPVERNAPAVALVGRHGEVVVVATVGVHPHDARTADDAAFAALARWLAVPGVVAVGETGLDFHYDRSPRPAQRATFARHVALARAHRRPLVVHVRAAHVEAADLLRAEGAAAVGGVIHCFTGDAADARRYLDLGFAISVAGIVTFRNAEALREAVRLVPAERLLIETDAPYLAPVPHRGRRNEPALVRVVAEAVAAARGESLAAVAAATTANARRLFAPAS
ncbi:MAG TPA: TatD family hydrolase [Candidatus Binatia bacterium]|nr:TatD family hydrolase [Candidatus Binatia bacterium]